MANRGLQPLRRVGRHPALFFLLIAKLVNVPPDDIVTDFMDNLSCGSWKRKGRDKAKEKLVDYFIEHGYGQEYYTAEDIRTMFKELDVIGCLAIKTFHRYHHIPGLHKPGGLFYIINRVVAVQ